MSGSMLGHDGGVWRATVETLWPASAGFLRKLVHLYARHCERRYDPSLRFSRHIVDQGSFQKRQDFLAFSTKAAGIRLFAQEKHDHNFRGGLTPRELHGVFVDRTFRNSFAHWWVVLLVVLAGATVARRLRYGKGRRS